MPRHRKKKRNTNRPARVEQVLELRIDTKLKIKGFIALGAKIAAFRRLFRLDIEEQDQISSRKSLVRLLATVKIQSRDALYAR